MSRKKSGRLADLLIIAGSLLIFAVGYFFYDSFIGIGCWKIHQNEFKRIQLLKLNAELEKLGQRQKEISAIKSAAPPKAVLFGEKENAQAINDLKHKITNLACQPAKLNELTICDLSGKKIVDRCTSCHLGINNPEFAEEKQLLFRTHPKLTETLAVHPPEKFGCTSCHGGDGSRLDVKHGTILNGHLVQASCAACHDNAALLPGAKMAAEGARIFQSKACYACHEVKESPFLNTELRPWAPDLHKIKGKSSAAWLYTWIKDPKKWNPRAMMPQFGAKGEGLSSEEAEQIASYLLAKSENITLSAQSQEYLQSHVPSSQSKDRGSLLFKQKGCLGCHDLGNSRAAGPIRIRLDGIGSKVSPEWLYSWIEDPHKMSANTIMPKFDLSKEELCDLVDFLAGQKSLASQKLDKPVKLAGGKNLNLTDPAKLEAGSKLIGKYGCYNCHSLPGFENNRQKIGAELSDFGSRDPISFSWGKLKYKIPKERRSWYNYTTTKLSDSKAFETKRIRHVMPNYNLSSSEKEQLAVFLRSLNTAKSSGALKPTSSSQEIALVRGSEIINRYGCLGCHSIYDEHESGLQKQIVLRWGTLAPNLSGEGQRVNSDWLAHFLKEPQKLRPQLTTSMPRFNFTKAELKYLLEYFEAQPIANRMDIAGGIVHQSSGKDVQAASTERADLLSKQGKKLFQQFRCGSCHTINNNPIVQREDPTWYQDMQLASRMAPDFLFARQRLQTAWTRNWLKNPHSILPDTTMPFLSISANEAEALRVYINSFDHTTGTPSPSMPACCQECAQTRK